MWAYFTSWHVSLFTYFRLTITTANQRGMMSSQDKVESVSCPICDREFPASEIERHADRCSFLKSTPDEGLNTSASNKRQMSEPLRSPLTVKRAKSEIVKRAGSSSGIITPLPKETATTTVPGGTWPGLARSRATVPLAEQMRPSDLSEFVGQDHVLGQNKVLRTLLEKRDIPSMILWGPPGCGKVRLEPHRRLIFAIFAEYYSVLLLE